MASFHQWLHVYKTCFHNIIFELSYLYVHLWSIIFEWSTWNRHIWIAFFKLSPLNCLYLGLSLTVNCSTTDRQFSEFWRPTIKDFVFSVIVIPYHSTNQFNFSLFRIRLICHLYVLNPIQFKTQTDDTIKIFFHMKIYLVFCYKGYFDWVSFKYFLFNLSIFLYIDCNSNFSWRWHRPKRGSFGRLVVGGRVAARTELRWNPDHRHRLPYHVTIYNSIK